MEKKMYCKVTERFHTVTGIKKKTYCEIAERLHRVTGMG